VRRRGSGATRGGADGCRRRARRRWPEGSSGEPFSTARAWRGRGGGGEIYPGVGGEGNTAEEEIGGEVGAPAVSSGGGGAPVPACASRGGEVVRVEQGVVLPLYRVEREGGRARRRWSGSSPAGH
jgi:hypothetical protein